MTSADDTAAGAEAAGDEAAEEATATPKPRRAAGTGSAKGSTTKAPSRPAGKGPGPGAGRFEGTGPARSRKAASSGRTTPKGQTASGRYTPPIPNYKKQSPPWYPWLILAIFIVGLVVIVINYAQVFWNPASNWALAGGLGCILIGAIMATQWH